MSVSMQGRFWRLALRLALKPQTLAIPQLREQSAKNASMLGKIVAGTRLETLDIQGSRAEWLHPAGGPTRQAILYFHGGGYVSGSIESHRQLCSLIAARTGVSVLVPEYRLAPENPYPAALEDALKVYRWLVATGFKPAELLIAGDSAGGGLTLATALALRDAGDTLPAGLICLSPWTDLALTGKSHTSLNQEEVILKTKTLGEWAQAYAGPDQLKDPLVSPLFADFHGLPPVFIQVGSMEILLDDALGVAEKARAAGVLVELKVWQGLWHVWQILGDLLPENRAAFDEITRFARARLGGGAA